MHSRFVGLLTAAALCLNLQICSAAKPKGRMTVWQLPNQTRTQMMSYVIETAKGNLIVIDGGNTGDAAYLKGFLAAKGDHVHTWIITHAHDDHFGALGQILSQPQQPKIDRLQGSLPSSEWVHKYAKDPYDIPKCDQFLATVAKAGRTIEELPPGKAFDIDGVRFQILAGHRPEITNNPINNSSLVLRVTDRRTSVLFTADLGVEGGQALLASPFACWLEAEYVQMAHHGQNGVAEEFYRAVKPRACLWPTPDWLWDNNSGAGKGSGKWKTLEVRAWMDKLGVKKHLVMKDGLAVIP